MATHSITENLSKQDLGDLDRIVSTSHRRYVRLLEFVGTRRLPVNRRRGSDEEDVGQDALLSLTEELRRQRNILLLRDLCALEPEARPDEQLFGRLAAYLCSEKNLRALAPKLPKGQLRTEVERISKPRVEDSQASSSRSEAVGTAIAEAYRTERNAYLATVRWVTASLLSNLLNRLSEFLRSEINLKRMAKQLPPAWISAAVIDDWLPLEGEAFVKPTLADVRQLVELMEREELPSFRALLGLFVVSKVFESGCDVRRWLLAVARNKATDRFRENIEYDGPSVVLSSADDDDLDCNALLSQLAGLSNESRQSSQLPEAIESLVDFFTDLSALGERLKRLHALASQQLALQPNGSRGIISDWLDWSTYQSMEASHKMSQHSIRRITFDFKRIPALAVAVSFRDPFIECLRSSIRAEMGMDADERSVTKRLRDYLEPIARTDFAGKGSRLIADLRDEP